MSSCCRSRRPRKKVLGVNKANAKAVGSIMVQAISPQAMDEAIQEMEELLRERHRILPGLDDDFTIRNLTEVFAAQETSAQVMAILLGAIASVSLIVGGIGIMNIMLVSGHGAHTRNRFAARRRSEAATHPVAVPGGSRHAFSGRGDIGIVVGVTASIPISCFANGPPTSACCQYWRRSSSPRWSACSSVITRPARQLF